MSWSQDYARKKLGLPKTTMVTSMGTLAPVGSPNFNQYLIKRLHTPHLVQPRPPSDSRAYNKIVRVPSASSQRARLGFKYWTVDPIKGRATSGDVCTTVHEYVVFTKSPCNRSWKEYFWIKRNLPWDWCTKALMLDTLKTLHSMRSAEH